MSALLPLGLHVPLAFWDSLRPWDKAKACRKEVAQVYRHCWPHQVSISSQLLLMYLQPKSTTFSQLFSTFSSPLCTPPPPKTSQTLGGFANFFTIKVATISQFFEQLIPDLSLLATLSLSLLPYLETHQASLHNDWVVCLSRLLRNMLLWRYGCNL